MSEGLDLERYMRRIGYGGPLRPDLATLAALQRAHVGAIPFEGLDPFLRRPVPLDVSALQAKIIDGARGGYCFELNTLFRAALEAIGFEVTGLAGRVRWMSPPAAPLGPREHMLLKVGTEDGPRLVDVGFGACLLDAPLPLVVDQQFETPLGVYRLADSDGRYELSVRRGEGWRALYVFDMQPQLACDYELGNWYTSTNTRPPFQHVIIIERVSAQKRKKLINRSFIVEGRDGIVESERLIADAAEFGRTLADEFGIVAPIGVGELFARTPQ